MEQMDKLLTELNAALKAESKAKKERIAIEESITALVEVPVDGSKTHTFSEYKVTVRGSINRKADFARMRNLKGLPSAAYLPIKTVERLDTVALRWLEENSPELHNKMLECIEAKPAKIAVTIKRLEK